MKMRVLLSVILCFFIQSYLLAADGPVIINNARGRVRILNGSVVTDRGTLLRGCRISTDMTEELPGRSEITSIKNLGLNAIHLYAESFVKHKPGELHQLVDTLVKWTAEDSLYLVITIGCLSENGSFDNDFARGFWEFYAPRYAEQTHVLYEIHNEPYEWAPPYSDAALAMERMAYSIIRSAAPYTHVLFFSYATPTNSEGILQDIKKLGRTVSWSNSSIAIHGYGVTDTELETVIRDVQNKGFGVVNTEPRNLRMETVNFRQVRIHEKNHVSYLHFLTTGEVLVPQKFKQLIDYFRITWKPDFGTWPSGTPEITAMDAFSRTRAELYDVQGGPSGVTDLDSGIGFISNGDYVVYNYLDFKNGAREFVARVASGGIGGFIEIRLDSLQSKIIGKTEVKPTGGWDNWKTLSCPVQKVDGIHKVYLSFTGGEWDLFNIDWFKFNRIMETSDKTE